jgi:molybdopterin molybdotransferase
MTEIVDAERSILARMPRAGDIVEPLERCVGRVLAEDVVAERDQPPFDRVTMDGIAIAFGDFAAGTRRYALAGTQAAGAPRLERRSDGDCLEVMTGAMLPAGCDTVVPIERLERVGNTVVVSADVEVSEGQFVHRRGSDRRSGSVVLRNGTVVRAPEMAVLASAGRARIAVAAVPRVAVVSTGNELVDVDEPIAPHQIRSSNDRAIEAALTLHRLGTVTRARLPDDEGVLLDAIARLHAEHDVMILSGGVSMGQFDFVPAVLDRLGVELVFHKIAQRPGRPMWFGVARDAKPVFALPGNPVSTLVCTARYVVPALRAALGLAPYRIEHARLSEDVRMPPRLGYFLPVALESRADGVLLAEPNPTNTSGDFIALAGTDGFVELPRGPEFYGQGTPVRLFRW